MRLSSTKKVLLITAIIGTFLLLLLALVLVESQAEGGNIKTFGDALWYAVVTLTTVGYGDSYPISIVGKLLGLVFIFLSLGLLSFVIGSITNTINQLMEKRKLGQFGTDKSGHVIILGWNKLGRLIVEQITEANQSVVVISDNKSDVKDINEKYDDSVFAIYSDPIWNEQNLENANIDQANSIFINIEDDSTSLVGLINIKQAIKAANIVVQISNSDLKETFINAGATYVIPSEEISSKLTASFLFEPEVALFTEDLITTVGKDSENFDLQQFHVSANNTLVSKSYDDAFAHLKQEFNALLVGIVKHNNGKPQLIKNPRQPVIIEKEDYLLLISDGSSQLGLTQFFGTEQGRKYTK